MNGDERRRARAEFELAEAERRFSRDPGDRRLMVKATIGALLIHGAVLAVQLPDFASEPERVDAPEEMMQIRFLQPPPPPPPPEVTPPEPPEPKKRIPRPDPRPEEPEPIVTPPPVTPPPEPQIVEPVPAPTFAPAPPAPTGPIRVDPGAGPGLIKKVEPEYPPAARVARLTGEVVLDVTIGADGTVKDVDVISSPSPILTRPAVEAAKKWLFAPGSNDVIMKLTVKYELR